MKKRFFVLAALVGMSAGAMAQKKGFDYTFYGQVRTDVFYNSRSNSETVDGLFYMYPKDVNPDADGNDLNGKANNGFYVLYTRLGVDVKGPMLGKIKTSAKVEADFRGSGTSYSTVRIRHAYFNLAWNGSALLVGQTWHPLYGDVAPDILNLNMGAPYQPFSRAPQIRYKFNTKHFGPSSDIPGATGTTKSQSFLKNSLVPEFYVGLDYKATGLIAGVGAHLSSMTPRTQSVYNDKTYEVNERVTGVSAEAHVKYTHDLWLVAAKSVLGSNLTQTSTVGGYGITATDARTGEQEYTPLRVSHTWLNVMYGRKWRGNVSGLIGTGTNIDQLTTATAELTFNLPNWKFGAEYSWIAAWYGSNDAKGKVVDTHQVDNHRIVLTALFQF